MCRTSGCCVNWVGNFVGKIRHACVVVIKHTINNRNISTCFLYNYDNLNLDKSGILRFISRSTIYKFKWHERFISLVVDQVNVLVKLNISHTSFFLAYVIIRL